MPPTNVRALQRIRPLQNLRAGNVVSLSRSVRVPKPLSDAIQLSPARLRICSTNESELEREFARPYLRRAYIDNCGRRNRRQVSTPSVARRRRTFHRVTYDDGESDIRRRLLLGG